MNNSANTCHKPCQEKGNKSSFVAERCHLAWFTINNFTYHYAAYYYILFCTTILPSPFSCASHSSRGDHSL